MILNLTNALQVFGIASQMSSTLVVGLALDLVATNVWVGWVTSVLGRTRAEWFVLDRFTGREFSTEGKVARVLTTSAGRQRVEGTGILIRTLSITHTLIGLETSTCDVTNCSGGTTAFVRSKFVEADHCGWADGNGGVAALVDVSAALRGLDKSFGT